MVVELVNIRLKYRIINQKNKDPIKTNIETYDFQKVPLRRSEEEFQVYLRELFCNNNSNLNYHWHFSKKKAKKNQYCGIRS